MPRAWVVLRQCEKMNWKTGEQPTWENRGGPQLAAGADRRIRACLPARRTEGAPRSGYINEMNKE